MPSVRKLTIALLCIAARAVAQNPAKLQTLNPVVSQFEDGPALAASDRIVAGETVFFRFDALGYKISDAAKVQLTGRVQVLDSRGTPIAPKDEIVIGTSLRDEDKDWKPRFRTQFQVPPIAPPGVYHIRFEVTDDQAHAAASGESSFTVAGADVPSSPALTIRSLNFYRTADDETPLRAPAAYRAGDMVWVRFNVAGYKYGDQNAIDVAYDVSVSNAAGTQLFTQENAAVEKSQAFYPQPWVPGSFSLTLQPNTAPGLYSVTITARDGVGNQTTAEKAQFRVE